MKWQWQWNQFNEISLMNVLSDTKVLFSWKNVFFLFHSWLTLGWQPFSQSQKFISATTYSHYRPSKHSIEPKSTKINDRLALPLEHFRFMICCYQIRFGLFDGSMISPLFWKWCNHIKTMKIRERIFNHFIHQLWAWNNVHMFSMNWICEDTTEILGMNNN